MKQGGIVFKAVFCFSLVVLALWAAPVLGANLAVPSLQYPSIQAAIDAAASGDVVVVKDGTYSGRGNADLIVDKAITIEAEKGANPVINCVDTTNGTTSRGVTFLGPSASGAELIGFTITGGNGMTNSNPPNPWEGWGGAILIYNSDSIIISDCNFSNNVATGFGGAIASTDSSPIISHCVIENNSASIGGGGLFIWGASPTGAPPLIINCRITGNPGNNPGISAGAAVYLVQSDATFYNCLIAGNSATSNGGAFFLSNSSSPNIIYCTISQNSGGDGGGGICSFTGCFPVVTNSILWGNSAANGPEIYLSHSSLDISYSDVSRGDQDANITLLSGSTIQWGDGNIDLDPLFVGQGDSPYELSPDSPCIDAGIVPNDNSNMPQNDLFEFDIKGKPRVSGDAPDMGAYEFQVQEDQVIQVQIDIKPGCWDKRINLKSLGLLPVAVKTTDDFDARSIDPRTVTLNGVAPVWRLCYDVDRDRHKDMLFFFRIERLMNSQFMSLASDGETSEATLTLTGKTKDEKAFEGTGQVTIVKPKKHKFGF
jgi:predicted outer membrane repeat protein/parallel beta-helix repeat protein